MNRDLHLVAILQIAAAIAAPLAACLGHIRCLEFQCNVKSVNSCLLSRLPPGLVCRTCSSEAELSFCSEPPLKFSLSLPSNKTTAPAGDFAPSVGLLRSVFLNVASFSPLADCKTISLSFTAYTSLLLSAASLLSLSLALNSVFLSARVQPAPGNLFQTELPETRFA